MSVGNDEEINFCRIVRVYIPVSFFNIRAALMHTAINGESRLISFDDKTGTCNFSGCSEKFNFHYKSFLIGFTVAI
jgi:hypothetical protein